MLARAQTPEMMGARGCVRQSLCALRKYHDGVAAPKKITPEMEARLKRDFTYHAPKGDQARRYEVMRFYAREFARMIVTLTPPSREQSVALTDLDHAVMMANAAIARNE